MWAFRRIESDGSGFPFKIGYCYEGGPFGLKVVMVARNITDAIAVVNHLNGGSDLMPTVADDANVRLA